MKKISRLILLLVIVGILVTLVIVIFMNKQSSLKYLEGTVIVIEKDYAMLKDVTSNYNKIPFRGTVKINSNGLNISSSVTGVMVHVEFRKMRIISGQVEVDAISSYVIYDD